MLSFINEDVSKIKEPFVSKKFIENTIKPSHGTTTLAFTFKEGIIVAVDSRATSGSYISSQTVDKVIEINDFLLGTMAGGAADCFYWEKKLYLYAKKYELENNKRISVSHASRYLSSCIYRYLGYGLSMGTMVCGYDNETPKIFMITDDGGMVENNLFSVGSGSTIAHGVLSSKYKYNLSKEEAIQLGKDSIYAAGHRDAFSGGTVNVYYMNSKGWEKIGRWDFNQIREEKENK